MAKKNKRIQGQRRAELDHFAIAQRELGKHNAKQALKSARLAYQEQPDEPRRQLLQRTLVARTEQLYHAGNHPSAKELLAELAGLGATWEPLLAPLQRLQMLLGVANPGGAPAGGQAAAPPEEAATMLADQAVLHPHRRSPAYPQINCQADVVREALRDVERGEDAAATDRMAQIPRKSPFADWRMFVRGLAAHYEGDDQKSMSHWDRLDPQRPAYRISRTLLAFAGKSPAKDERLDCATGLRRLQYAIAGNDFLNELESIRDLLQAGREREALTSLRSLRQRCGRSHVRLLQRLTDMLWKRFAADVDGRHLNLLCRIAPPPPLDPHWHRARALFAEEDDDSPLDDMQYHWLAYVKDLQTCQVLREDERKIAAGLVMLRLAREFIHSGEAADRFDSRSRSKDESPPGAPFRAQAEKFLRQAIGWHPGLLEAHRELVSLLLAMDQPEQAYQASCELLEHFPDDFQSLVWTGNYLIEAGEPAEAEPYVERACRLRPRDAAAPGLIWQQRLAMLRELVRKRRFEAARQKLQEAFVAPPADIPPYTRDVLQAVIEYKAKDPETAERHVQAAVAQLQEPTVIWLMLHSYAARYGLDRQWKNEFRDRLKAAFHRPPNGQTAGHAADYLTGFLSRKVKYVGLATHQRLLENYLGACKKKKIAWQREDLRSVCQFLRHCDGWRSHFLQTHFLPEGCRRFPRDPLFPLLNALDAMRRSTRHLPPQKIIADLERALKLNETADQRLSVSEVEEAKAGLARAHSILDMFSMMQDVWGRMPEFLSRAFLHDDDDYDDDDDDDDDDWETAWDTSPAEPNGRRKAGGGSRSPGPAPDKSQRFFPF